MSAILAETSSFLLTNLYEDVWFQNKKTGQRIFAGDHHGYPEFGLISESGGWCVSGGEGVILSDKDGNLWSAFRFQGRDLYSKLMAFENEVDALWIEHAIKQTNEPGYVSGLDMLENGEVEIQLDPSSRLASKWRLDVQKMSLRKF